MQQQIIRSEILHYPEKRGKKDQKASNE